MSAEKLAISERDFMRGMHRLRKIKEGLQAQAFTTFGMQSYLDRQEQEKLSLAMGFVGQWDEHRRFQMEFLKSKGVEPHHRFLEIGSGPLTLGTALILYLDANRYTGVDVRASVNNIAYSELSKHALAEKNPRLLTSTSFGADEVGDVAYDFILSFSVMFHLTDELVTQLFERVGKTLAPDGRYWANINRHEDESRWLEFPFQKREPAFYGELAGRNGLEMTELGTLKDLGFGLDTPEKSNVFLEFRHKTVS